MTLTNLYRKTLERLQVAAAGEPTDPDDTLLVAAKYTALYAMLLELSLVAWAADEAVPDNVALPLVEMLAFASAGEFGQDPNAYANGALGLLSPSLAEQQLRRVLALQYVSEPAQSEYF